MTHHHNAQMIPAIVSSFKSLFYVLDPYMDDAMRHHAKLLEQALVDHNTEVAAATTELTMQRDTAETSLALTDLKVSMKDFGLRQLKHEMETQAAANENAKKAAAEQFGKVLDNITERLTTANDMIANLLAKNAELTKQVNELTARKEGEQPASANEPQAPEPVEPPAE